MLRFAKNAKMKLLPEARAAMNVILFEWQDKI